MKVSVFLLSPSDHYPGRNKNCKGLSILDCAGLYWNVLGFTGLNWAELGCNEMYCQGCPCDLGDPGYPGGPGCPGDPGDQYDLGGQICQSE